MDVTCRRAAFPWYRHAYTRRNSHHRCTSIAGKRNVLSVAIAPVWNWKSARERMKSAREHKQTCFCSKTKRFQLTNNKEKAVDRRQSKGQTNNRMGLRVNKVLTKTTFRRRMHSWIRFQISFIQWTWFFLFLVWFKVRQWVDFGEPECASRCPIYAKEILLKWHESTSIDASFLSYS